MCCRVVVVVVVVVGTTQQSPDHISRRHVHRSLAAQVGLTGIRTTTQQQLNQLAHTHRANAHETRNSISSGNPAVYGNLFVSYIQATRFRM